MVEGVPLTPLGTAGEDVTISYHMMSRIRGVGWSEALMSPLGRRRLLPPGPVVTPLVLPLVWFWENRVLTT